MERIQALDLGSSVTFVADDPLPSKDDQTPRNKVTLDSILKLYFRVYSIVLLSFTQFVRGQGSKSLSEKIPNFPLLSVIVS